MRLNRNNTFQLQNIIIKECNAKVLGRRDDEHS